LPIGARRIVEDMPDVRESSGLEQVACHGDQRSLDREAVEVGAVLSEQQFMGIECIVCLVKASDGTEAESSAR
jgi:hypothetical protein